MLASDTIVVKVEEVVIFGRFVCALLLGEYRPRYNTSLLVFEFINKRSGYLLHVFKIHTLEAMSIYIRVTNNAQRRAALPRRCSVVVPLEYHILMIDRAMKFSNKFHI